MNNLKKHAAEPGIPTFYFWYLTNISAKDNLTHSIYLLNPWSWLINCIVRFQKGHLNCYDMQNPGLKFMISENSVILRNLAVVSGNGSFPIPD